MREHLGPIWVTSGSARVTPRASGSPRIADELLQRGSRPLRDLPRLGPTTIAGAVELQSFSIESGESWGERAPSRNDFQHRAGFAQASQRNP